MNTELNFAFINPQPALTCSKSTMETLEHCVKSVQDVVLVSLLVTLNRFYLLFQSVSY